MPRDIMDVMADGWERRGADVHSTASCQSSLGVWAPETAWVDCQHLPAQRHNVKCSLLPKHGGCPMGGYWRSEHSIPYVRNLQRLRRRNLHGRRGCRGILPHRDLANIVCKLDPTLESLKKMNLAIIWFIENSQMVRLTRKSRIG